MIGIPFNNREGRSGFYMARINLLDEYTLQIL
jgi:hypothetical protein